MEKLDHRVVVEESHCSSVVLCMWLRLVATVFLLLRVSSLEFASTGELYDELLRTECYTLVYVYAVGCPWCEALDPHFDQLPTLFGREVRFARVEGRRARNFARDFHVESYPELLLFAPRSRGGLRPQELLAGGYGGPWDTRAIAHWVGEHTGLMPRWAEPGDGLELEALETLHSTATAVLLFVSPWMGARHRQLLLHDSLGLQRVRLWTVDCTLEQWSGLVNEFRVAGAPKAFVLAHGAVVAVDLLEYDRQVWQHEQELFSRLLDAAEDYEALRGIEQEFHSVNVYRSLQEMQLECQKRQDESIEDELVAEQLVSRIHCI